MPNHYSVCEIEKNLTMAAAKTVSFMIKHERTKHFRSRTESPQTTATIITIIDRTSTQLNLTHSGE
jgi:hypothetical protein